MSVNRADSSSNKIRDNSGDLMWAHVVMKLQCFKEKGCFVEQYSIELLQLVC